MGLVAMPWGLHGGTDMFFTRDSHADVTQAAIECIKNYDEYPDIRIQYYRR